MNIRLTTTTRKLWAEKIFDLTNIGAGALLFGQFLSENKFSWVATLAGLILIITGYIISYLLIK